jgi:putative two-component system response regulator
VTASEGTRGPVDPLAALKRVTGLVSAGIQGEQLRAAVAEAVDEETYQHTERVGRLAAVLAAAAGIPERDVELIRRAAPLHDIGKLGVPGPVLLKQGQLDWGERGLMRAHTRIGAEILAGSDSDVIRLAEEIALTHHERWDGSGYPRGLAGEEIPLSGRVVAIADVFDALTHSRPYRDSLTVDEAMARIRAGSGAQFDPALVETFTGLDRELLLTTG